jgi:hypothetical protein
MKRFAFAFCLVCLPVTLAGQEKPEAAPGLRVPGTAMPYALDSFAGKPELIPIHHSNVSVNNHTGANVAGGWRGLFSISLRRQRSYAERRRQSLCTLADPFFISILTEMMPTTTRILLAGRSFGQKQTRTDASSRRFALLSSPATASTTMTSSTRRKAIFRTVGRPSHPART